MSNLNVKKNVAMEVLKRRAHEKMWKGPGGFTDYDVYRSMIEVGQEYGKLRTEGVEVSISVRELSLLARVSYRGTLRSLKRLDQAGLITRAARGEGTMAGSWMLLVGDEGVVSNEQEHSTVEMNNSSPIPRFRWGTGKLGKFSSSILETIHTLGCCKRPEIAKALGRKSRDIKKSLNRLVDRGLVVREGDSYSLPSNVEEILEETLLSDGTIETDLRHKEHYEKEREAYRINVIGEETNKEGDVDG